MLSDHKLVALRDIKRRLGWDSPELARLFSTVETPPPKHRGKRARAECWWRQPCLQVWPY